MSLILAIEPDRRQVAHLISIVRHVQGAELILADTTERALESIGNSVPDLILVPALLSPQDDAALAAALRVIATAAHVQMLTIPTFATPKPQPKRGVLSAFRRKPANDAPLEGCDPKVFAQEIASYIERANEERAAAQLYEDDQDTLQPETPAVVFEAADAETVAAFAPIAELAVEDAAVEQEAATEQEAAVEEPAAVVPVLDELVTALEESEPSFAEPVAAAPPVPAMALDEFVATLEQTSPVAIEEPIEAVVEPFVEDVVPMAAAPAPVAEPAAPEFEDLLADLERANLPVIEVVRAEQWMAGTDEPAHEGDSASDTFEDEADHLDIDLSIELDAVLHVDEAAPAPAQALKPFEPVVPVERFEPLPLAAWQAWPRLDWTPPERPAVPEAHAGNGNGHDQPAASIVEDFDQVAEFEEALEAEVAPERFEPVVPVERVEPMPLSAWQAWPRLEGVAAETYVEPIAPRKVAAKPEWVELMRSLREDIARRRSELAASGPVPPPAQKPQRPRAAETRVQAAKPAPAPAAAAELKKPRPKRTRPIEDEWGLFDPEQCGFAALLDKLDEMTVTPAKHQKP